MWKSSTVLVGLFFLRKIRYLYLVVLDCLIDTFEKYDLNCCKKVFRKKYVNQTLIHTFDLMVGWKAVILLKEIFNLKRMI